MHALAPRSIFWCVPPGLRRTSSEPIPFSTRYIGDRRKLHRVGSSRQAPPDSVGPTSRIGVMPIANGRPVQQLTARVRSYETSR